MRPEDELLFTCAPGTAVIFDNRLLHGGGPNKTDEVRYAIQGYCCRSATRPFCDHTRSIPPEVVKNATPLMRRLWGFGCQSMWEEAPRHFALIEVPDASPRFNYNANIDREA